MNIHLIAIGGSIMHSLAIELKNQGHKITGSDDTIYGASKVALEKEGLLPTEMGWDETRIQDKLDLVIVGMHAKKDNPELHKAKELGLKVLSFPEYLYEHSKEKHRVVIAGSHGKTTISGMVTFVLKETGNLYPDYVIGASIPGLDQTIKLTKEAKTIILEGDEYATSPTDHSPKFLKYHHHMVLISGIAWDHANIFPTEKDYEQAFQKLIDQSGKAGVIVYCAEDKKLVKMLKPLHARTDMAVIGYKKHKSKIKNGITYLDTKEDGEIPLNVFGDHNLENISGAKEVCKKLGVSDQEFYQAIAKFKPANLRLNKIKEVEGQTFFRDFAHAPSKVEATLKALKNQFKGRQINAILELHTISSTKESYMAQYKGLMDTADEQILFINTNKYTSPGQEFLQKSFDSKKLKLFTSKNELEDHLTSLNYNNSTTVFMSSGNFDSLDIDSIVESLN
jgi:UDP-N-acetylmuramate: L-alanyl-gamma-D-glutamyl-meso-diaminopimelate ligase